MVTVRLTEATPITGGLLFEMLSDPEPRDPNAPAPRLGVRGRGDRPPPRGGGGGGAGRGGARGPRAGGAAGQGRTAALGRHEALGGRIPAPGAGRRPGRLGPAHPDRPAYRRATQCIL